MHAETHREVRLETLAADGPGLGIDVEDPARGRHLRRLGWPAAKDEQEKGQRDPVITQQRHGIPQCRFEREVGKDAAPGTRPAGQLRC